MCKKTTKATECLIRLKRIDILVANKQAEKRMWLEMATGTTAKVGGERVQSSSDHHTMEKQVVEAATIDEEIASLRAEKAAIIKTLERLDSDQYDFLHKAYVQNMTFKEIQYLAGKSYSWATTMHRKAKESLEKLL